METRPQKVEKMKLLITYLTLVGLPVLGVLGVLHVGRGLTSPVSVSGSWNVEVSRQLSGYSSCEDVLRQSQPLVLTISQSGPHVFLSFDNNKKIKLAGAIESTSVNASSLHLSARTVWDDRNSPDAMRLYATFDREAGAGRLVGSLNFNKCPGAPEMTFIATRQTKSNEK